MEMLPQLLQGSRGDSFWANGTKMLIEERDHSVLECGSNKKGPGKVLLEQNADALRTFSIHASASTTEQQFDFRTSHRCCDLSGEGAYDSHAAFTCNVGLRFK